MITAQDIDIVDLPWLEQRGFRARPEVRSTLRYNARTKTYPVYVTVTRASDRGIIDIHYEETDRRDRMEGKPRVSAMIGDYTPPVASGFPLGVDQYRFIKDATSYQYVATGYGYLGITYGDSGGISAKGSRVMAKQDWTQWDPWIESLARSIVASAVFRRLDPDAPSRFGTVEVPAFRCRLSETRFLKLREWAIARSYSIQAVENAVRLSRNGVEVLIPLGSDRVKVGSRWVPLPDLVAERNGSWYVPDEIDRIAR